MAKRLPFSRNDALFHRELSTGHRWAQRVGERLRESGYPVTVTPMEWRDNLADLQRFRSERDIVVGRPGGPEFVVEVKSRGFEFGDHWSTYPHTTAMVDTVEGWDTKAHRDQVRAVVLISQRTGGMLVVPVRATRATWKPVLRYDKVREHDALNYEVPTRLLLPMASLIRQLAAGEWETT